MLGTCVIVGAGDFSPRDLPRKRETDLFIAADGGIDRLASAGITPDVFVGDIDSAKAPPEGIECLILPRRKDDTDMLASVRVGLDRGYREFLLLGGTGGKRMSHTVANLQTLEFIKSRGARGVLKSGNTSALCLSKGEREVFQGERGYFSLFSLTDCAIVTLRGAMFSGEKLLLTRQFPIGASNEFESGETSVSVDSGTVLLICEFDSDQPSESTGKVYSGISKSPSL